MMREAGGLTISSSATSGADGGGGSGDVGGRRGGSSPSSSRSEDETSSTSFDKSVSPSPAFFGSETFGKMRYVCWGFVTVGMWELLCGLLEVARVERVVSGCVFENVGGLGRDGSVEECWFDYLDPMSERGVESDGDEP
ncbi:hypothetical protein C2S52_015569 [Perilla frutescens var. hirtella]|nr:hypothetical protein C2S52_015569 [Perilla frutescens var. hirtella]